MYAEIAAAIQSTKTAIELVRAAHSLSNHSELLAAVTAVQMQLTDAIASALSSQEKQAELLERVRELEKRLSEVTEWNQLMQRYSLFEFPTKALAYALRDGMENGEPMHYLCVACVDRKRRSTLQPSGVNLFCPECKLWISTKSQQSKRTSGRGESWKTV